MSEPKAAEAKQKLVKTSKLGGVEDWTDEKHTDRKKRDRILPDGVVMKLIKKSDWEGCKRFFSNMALMALTAHTIHLLGIYPTFRDASIRDCDQLKSVILSFGDIRDLDQLWPALLSLRDSLGLDQLWQVLSSDKMMMFIPLYIFYGFQMQCMAFAGGHELLHGSAFKTKWMNTLVTFFVSTAFFEVLWHERINHKQHHIFTLDIDNDPELSSFYSRKELEAPKFKSAPQSRFSWLWAFVNVQTYFKDRVCRLLSSCMGIATDYTGLGWSMKTPKRDEIPSAVVSELQLWSLLQLSIYIGIFSIFGTSVEGIKALVFWWIAPCIIGYGPINYFRNAEHTNCDLTNNQLLNTRTVESNFFIRWLLWETNFHCEHHAYPMVPFYNLPVLHKLLDPHIKHNTCKSFTRNQWEMIKPGGWIDTQNS